MTDPSRDFPWNLLDIAPTTDEMVVRRAYARRLKVVRPDTDPEAFARLVNARQVALQFCAAGASKAGSGAVSAPGPADQSEASASAPHAPDEPQDLSSGFSSRQAGARFESPPSTAPDAQTAAVRSLLNRLRSLIFDANEAPRPDPQRPPRLPIDRWQAAPWKAALAGLDELTVVNRRIVRDFIVAKALPLLELAPVGSARLRLVEAPGACAVVAILESEFAIASDQARLTQLCGAQAMLCYLDWAALAGRLRPLEEPSEAERQLMACLDRLLPLTGATPKAAQLNWQPDRFEEIRALLGRMQADEKIRSCDRLAERLTALLPRQPFGSLTDATPAGLILALERDFALSSRIDSPLIEPSPASRYHDWLFHARQLRAAAERNAIGAAAYRDEAGIPLIPADDLALEVLPHRVARPWEQAQRDGRWPLSFSFLALLMPAIVLETQGLRWWGLLIAVIEPASLLILANSPPAPFAIFFAIVLTTRLTLAFTMPRLIAQAAVKRVKRADRMGVVTNEDRKRIIAYENFPIVALLTLVAALTFVIISYPIWHEANMRVQRSLDDWIALGQKDLKNSSVRAAIDAFSAAIAKGNAPAPAYQGRADAYMADSRPDLAIADYDRAIALRAGNYDRTLSQAYRGRAGAFARLGEPQRALADYDQAIALNSDDIGTHLDRIDTAFILKRGDLAVSDYEAVERIDPLYGRQRNLLAWERGASLWLEHNQHYLPQGMLGIVVAAMDPDGPDGRDLYSTNETVVIAFVDRTGHIVARALETSSGIHDLDDAALATLTQSDPLPVPPHFSTSADAKEMLRIRALFHVERSQRPAQSLPAPPLPAP